MPGRSDPSEDAEVDTPVAPPSDAVATVLSPTSVHVTWQDNSQTESGVVIERSSDGAASWQPLAQFAPGAGEYFDYSAPDGATLQYRITAIGPAYLDLPNSTPALTSAVATPLNTPTGLQEASLSDTQVELAWHENSVNATGFDISRSTDGATFTKIGSTPAGTTSFIDGSASPDSNYVYQVVATGGAQNSAPATVDGWGLGDPPLAPSGLVAASASPTSVVLGWTNNALPGTASGIQVGVWELNLVTGEPLHGGPQTLATLPPDATTYTATVAAAFGGWWGTAPVEYAFAVVATNVAASSPYSNTAIAAPPPDPTVAAPGALTLTFNAQGMYYSIPSGPLLGTEIEAVPTGQQQGGPESVYTFNSPNGFTNVTYRPGASTTWYLRDYNAGGFGPWASVTSTSPDPYAFATAPPGLAAAAVSPSEIDVTWGANETGDTTVHGSVLLDYIDPYGITRGSGDGGPIAGGYTFDVGLTDGTTYYIQVLSGNTGGDTHTDWVSATTPLKAPENLAATANGSREVDLSWLNSSVGATGVRILRSPDGQSFTTLTTVGASATSYFDTTVTAGTHYWYEVEAVQSSGAHSSPDESNMVQPRVPSLTPPPEQVVGQGQSLIVTAGFTGLTPGEPATALVDWNDGNAPVSAAVSVGNDTITADLGTAPAPGVYHPTITLYDEDGVTATTTFTLDVWGVVLGDGKASDVLVGSDTGEGNVQPLTLTYPHPAGETLDLTLTPSDDSVADVWSTSSPGAGDTPVLSAGTPSYSFTTGASDANSTTLWVGAVEGSTTLDDLDYALSGTPSPSPTPTPSPTPAPTTATSNPASAVTVHLISGNDPNNTGVVDVTDKTSNWLVGQMVYLLPQVTGPPQLASNSAKKTYQWTVPGNVQFLFDPATGKTIPLKADNAVAGPDATEHSGTAQDEIKFFWVATQAAGPDTDVVSVAVTLSDGQTVEGSTTYKLYSPTVTTTVKPGGRAGANGNRLGLVANPQRDPWGGGHGVLASADVSTPQPPGAGAFAQGQFQFTQVVVSDRTLVYDSSGNKTTYKSKLPTTVEIDGSFSYDAVTNPAYPNGGDPYPAGAVAWRTDTGAHWFADSPNQRRTKKNGGYNGIISATISDAFTTYVMYLAPGTQSQWVPLKYLSWNFQVAGTTDATQQSWTVSGTPAAAQSVPGSFTTATAEPKWAGVLTPENMFEKVP